MKLSARELINKFYDEIVKVKYPQLTRKQTNDICISPFRYVRMAMWEDFLPTVKMKYFGTFKPNDLQAVQFFKNLDRLYLENYIIRARYEYLKVLLGTFIRRRLREKEEEYHTNVAKDRIYKRHEGKYRFWCTLFHSCEEYEPLVPIKEDDLKFAKYDNKGKYNSLPRRDSSLQNMVQQMDELDDTETYSGTDNDED